VGDGATLGPGSVERDDRLDDGALSGGRAHLEVAPEQPRPLAHSEKTEMSRTVLAEALRVKAPTIVGHGQRELVSSELNGHEKLARPGVAKRVAHRLLSDAKGAEFGIGGKTTLGADDPEFDGEPGLVLYVGDKARKCGDEPELVEGRRAQVPREDPQAVCRIQCLEAGLPEATRHGFGDARDSPEALEASSQVQEELERLVMQLARQSAALILFCLHNELRVARGPAALAVLFSYVLKYDLG
jgi:hypothetical protein